MNQNPEILLSGLAFPESLRWHTGELWFSDVLAGRVMRATADGEAIEVARVSPSCSGIGWLPSGDLLVVECEGRRILRVDDHGGLTLHSDLSSRWQFPANDMMVDPDGTAWVGSFGYAPETDAPVPSNLIQVSPDGRPLAEVENLVFPNGMARLDEHHFVVSETFADRLAVVNTQGRPRVVDRISLAAGSTPDGLAVREDGSVWVALAYSECVMRVDLNTGQCERAIEIPDVGVYDCVFTGPHEILVASSTKDETHVLRDLPGTIMRFTLD